MVLYIEGRQPNFYIELWYDGLFNMLHFPLPIVILQLVIYQQIYFSFNREGLLIGQDSEPGPTLYGFSCLSLIKETLQLKSYFKGTPWRHGQFSDKVYYAVTMGEERPSSFNRNVMTI
jgi:hypothetical protein